MKSTKLLIIALLMMVAGLILSVYTLVFLISNQENISLKFSDFEKRISRISPVNISTTSDEEILKVVQDYCQYHNNCVGPQGLQGEKGETGRMGQQGLQGVTGIQGPRGFQGIQGETGATGPQGEKGEQGEPGADGREIERRCVVLSPTERRYEWRLTGDNWQVEYYLAQGQLCPQEVENG